MIYLFDKDERLFKVVSKGSVKTALQTFALTTERYVSDRLTVEMKMLSDEELEKAEYMAIQSVGDAHQYHYFYIAQKKSTKNITELIGVQSGIEELRKCLVYDQRPKDAFARDVISRLLEGTNWIARFVGDTQPRSTNFYYLSVFDALKKVCEVWDLEMQFFVEMNGNQIGARYIDFKQKIGASVGKRVVYGHNALEILQEVERTNIYTALVGRGKGEQVSSAGDISQGGSVQISGGYGRKITFEDVVWSRAKGDLVDKPKGQAYVELPWMTEKHGIRNADGSFRPKIGMVEFPEEEDRNVLLVRTFQALIDMSRPQVAFKTSAVYLKGVFIGDTIRVVRHDKRIDYDTRIFEITFNRLNNRSISIKLGDRVSGNDSLRMQSIASKAVDNFVNNEFSQFVQKLPEFLPSANGFNRNWYTIDNPVEKYPGKVIINDIWFKPDPEHEGHTIMLRWTGEAWDEILRTADLEVVKRKVEKDFNKLKSDFDQKLKDIDLSDLSLPDLDKIIERLSKVEKSNNVTAEMIGYDGLTRYNKNRADGQTTREQEFGAGNIEISHNGDGFEAGQTYTVSFSAECVPLVKKQVTVKVNQRMPLTVNFSHVYSKLDNMSADIAKDAKQAEIELWGAKYDAVVVSDWYKTQTVRVDASETDTVNLELEYREIADGNENGDYWIGYWDENPEFIFDGGSL